ncbi:hypothetical protein HYX05_05330, partial [Candidatus Woesearchaeota archaeon]|nr:hypothetical protein [Candidatus Woesearchaeota archaeon]
SAGKGMVMSAEKEIVNYWYNKKGLFTINNIRASGNRDAGILALKFDKNVVNDVFHIQVSCSITNNISEAANLGKSTAKIVDEKFEDKAVSGAISSSIRQFSIQKNNIKKIMVIGAMPKSRKIDIIKTFNEKGVEVIEFEDILYDVFEQLDTQYYKNDIIRTLQLMKFLLLSEPAKMAKILTNSSFTSASRKEFLSKILGNEGIVKEFRKTNVERLGAILKSSGLKAPEMAEMLENNVLNKKTRKLFLNTLMEQEKTKKLINKTKRIKKANVPLEKFFTNF